MSDLSFGNFANVVLNPGQILRVGTGGVATVLMNYGGPAGTTVLTAQTQDFGPYDVPAKLRVTATSGVTSYGVRDDVGSLTATQAAAVQALVSSDSNGGSQRVRQGPVRLATFGESTAYVGNLQNVTTATNFAADRVICDAWNSGTKSLGLALDKWALPCVYPMAYLVGSGGVSGENTTQMLARDAAAAATDRFAITDIQNTAPDAVLLRGGSINNLTSSTAGTLAANVATCVSEHITILNRLLSAGLVVIDEGIYGYSGTGATDPAVTRQGLLQVNAQIKAYIASLNTNRAKFIDWLGILHDSTGAFLPGMSVDGTHLGSLGQITAATLGEAPALSALFGPSPAFRYPGYNYVTNANMALSSASNATGYTLSGTNATVGAKAIEAIDGKIWQTAHWTLHASSANTCIINMPFNPSSTGAMAITSGDLWGFEFDLLLQNISGTTVLSDTGLFGQVRFVNTTGAGDVFINVISTTKGFAVPGGAGLKLHVVIPPVKVDDASANFTTASRFQMQALLAAQTGVLKIGVSQPRIVKLGQSYISV